MRLIALLIFFWVLPVRAVVIGSNTAVSRQAFVTFPEVDGDNEIRGFAALKDGFALENSSTSCLYNAFFPVGDAVSLKGGTLNLSKDLILQDSAEIETVGTIDGNNHSFLFTTTSGIELPSGSGNCLTYINNYTASTAVNSVDWHYGGGYLALGSSGGNIRVLSFNGSTVASVALSAYSKPIYSVRWRPNDKYIAVATDSSGGSKHMQIWDFNTTTSALTRTDNYNTVKQAVAAAWDPTGNYLATGNMQSPSAIWVFSFAGGTLTLKSDSTSLATGQSISDRAICWNASSNYFVVGADSYGDELRVYSYDGNTTVALNASVSIGKKVTAVDWSQTSSYIVVGLQGDTNNIRLYEHDPVGGTLTEKTSARIAETQTVKSVTWCSDGDKIAVGLQLDGGGTELRIYSFNENDISFSLDGALDLFGTINDVRWSCDETYIATGDSNYQVNVFNSGESQEEFVFRDIKLTFNSDVELKKKAIFQGECALCCNGYAFDLVSPGRIEVDSGASLLIDNTQLKGLSGTNMCCLDSLSTLSLCNDALLLDADFSFTQGHIDIVGDVAIVGPHVFCYKANQVSTIGSHATWFFDSGTTFSYDPSGDATNLIAFADSSSILHLYEATLYAPSTGSVFTKGRLIIEGECPVQSDATLQANGISLGDGVSESNNIVLKMLSESGFKLNSGYTVYKNIGG